MFNVFHEVLPTGERAGRRQITPFIFTFPNSRGFGGGAGALIWI
jgi:hypothetical protein